MKSVLLVLVATLGAAECQHTPREDFSQTGVSESPSSSSKPSALPATAAIEGDGGGCIERLPAQPPARATAVSPARCPANPESAPPKMDVVHVSFPQASGASVEAELARSAHDREIGLMYRTSLAEDRGMLFDLATRKNHEFWMHNTCIPLDMIFVDEDGRVVGIVEDAPPLDETPRGVGCPSRYVLEVNGGWSRRHFVVPGQSMTIPDQAR